MDWGKTYTVNTYQLLSCIAIMIGAALVLASALVYWYTEMLEAVGLLVK